METSLKKVLRVSRETPEVFTDEDVHSLLTDRPGDYFQFVHRSLQEIADGAVQLEMPSKQVFIDPGARSDFRLMPCVLRSRKGIRKTVKLVGTNTVQQAMPGMITVGQAFSIHPHENFITHTFSACILSSARTALCAALSVKLLAPRHRSIAIIGAGRIGYYSARYVATLGSLDTIYLYDVDPERCETLARILRQEPETTDIGIIPERPRGDVDVVLLATTSTEPVYGADDFFAATVISVGADTDWQHELDPRLLRDAEVFVDTTDCLKYGDLKQWNGEGLIAAGELTDLLTLIKRGPYRSSNSRRLFISTGSALYDNLTIGYLLSRTGDDTLYENATTENP